MWFPANSSHVSCVELSPKRCFAPALHGTCPIFCPTAELCWWGLTRPKQLSMAATARVIWLSACVRLWVDVRACHLLSLSTCVYLSTVKLIKALFVSGYFWVRNFFFPDSKISLSTRSVFKSKSPVHTHPMVSGFTLAKQGLHRDILPPYWFIVQKKIGHDFAAVHALPPSLRFNFFPLWRSSGFLSLSRTVCLAGSRTFFSRRTASNFLNTAH